MLLPGPSDYVTDYYRFSWENMPGILGEYTESSSRVLSLREEDRGPQISGISMRHLALSFARLPQCRRSGPGREWDGRHEHRAQYQEMRPDRQTADRRINRRDPENQQRNI